MTLDEALEFLEKISIQDVSHPRDHACLAIARAVKEMQKCRHAYSRHWVFGDGDTGSKTVMECDKCGEVKP